MTKIQVVFALIATMVILTGCAGNQELIKKMNTSVRQDVFKEITDYTSPVPGYVDLHIYSSLKTHKPGIYSDKDIHGTANYMLLVNIDGQATNLQGRLRAERSDARSMRDPEEGVGIRYQFTKKLRIKAGHHRVVIAIPTDDLATEREVVFSGGEINSLTVEPIYGSIPGKRPAMYGLTSFREGIKSIRLLLNGKTL